MVILSNLIYNWLKKETTLRNIFDFITLNETFQYPHYNQPQRSDDQKVFRQIVGRNQDWNLKSG